MPSAASSSEILTGHPPAEGTTTAEVFERIKAGRIPLARQLEPGVPPPLEAICAKALATDRDRRYASVKDLADEVRRWIADEPVSIYRDPFIVHALRWARRNRTAVASLSAALLAGVIGLGAVTAVTTRANARLNDANHEIDNQRLKAVNALAAESIARAEAGHRLVQARSQSTRS